MDECHVLSFARGDPISGPTSFDDDLVRADSISAFYAPEAIDDTASVSNMRKAQNSK
jgi:hypothetical protein